MNGSGWPHPPANPPKEWFTCPSDWLEPGHRLVVTDEGRIGGWWYDRRVPLVLDDGTEWTPPTSPSNYDLAFHIGSITTADGSPVRIGTLARNHPPRMATPQQIRFHLADPTNAIAVARCGDDDEGAWIAGALLPGTTPFDVALIRRSDLSGLWAGFPKAALRAVGVADRVAAAANWTDCYGPQLVRVGQAVLPGRFGPKPEPDELQALPKRSEKDADAMRQMLDNVTEIRSLVELLVSASRRLAGGNRELARQLGIERGIGPEVEVLVDGGEPWTDVVEAAVAVSLQLDRAEREQVARVLEDLPRRLEPLK